MSDSLPRPEGEVRVRALKKSFGKQVVLKGIDLDVARGEVVGLIGPNGAGKTTLMSCLLGFLHTDEGEITIDGRPNDDLRIRRRTGFVPERMNFDRRATGQSFLRYMARLAGVARTEADGRVKAMLERLSIANAADKRLSQYSRGMLQRIGMCQALIHEPDFLFLDEPTSGLDPLVQQTFYELIREAKAEGRTIFLSSHILSEVEKTCDRVAIIRDGRLVKVDRTEALRDLAHHEVELRFAGDPPMGAFAVLPGVSDVTADGNVLKMRVSGSITPVVREAANYELLDFVSREPSLEETFLAQYGRGTAEAA
jgi:ABC-2 type transport system ATP-binding protein